MTLQAIDPVAAKRLIDDGALLVDIREPDEHARGHVPGARNTPLSRLASLPADAKAIVFHCRSGARTSGNVARLAAAAGCEAYILEGGIDAWKKAGLPATVDRGQPAPGSTRCCHSARMCWPACLRASSSSRASMSVAAGW